MAHRFLLPLCVGVVLLLRTGASLAADINDGLGIEDGFSYEDTLKNKPNTKFHQAKARGKLRRADEDDIVISNEEGDVNVGSVVDSEVEGDVIIIMDDTETVISK